MLKMGSIGSTVNELKLAMNGDMEIVENILNRGESFLNYGNSKKNWNTNI